MDNLFSYFIKAYNYIPRKYRRKISRFRSKKQGILTIKQARHENFFMIKERVIPLFSDLYIIENTFTYEPFETSILKENICATDTFIDVGANVGYFTLLAHDKCSHVYSFEPDQDSFRRMQANLILNNVKNATTLNYALFNEEGISHLKKNRGKVIMTNSERFRLKDSDQKAIQSNDENFEQINLRVFDKLREEIGIPKVDFIKMDIEGAEIEALFGMERTLKEEHPKILLSVHPGKLKPFSRNNQDIYTFLEKLKYQYKVVGKEAISQVKDSSYNPNYTLFCW